MKINTTINGDGDIIIDEYNLFLIWLICDTKIDARELNYSCGIQSNYLKTNCLERGHVNLI